MHELWHGPMSLERYQTEQHIISEWVHLVTCINHRIFPVILPDYINIYVYVNKNHPTIINIVTGVQAEQSRNFGKMIILI